MTGVSAEPRTVLRVSGGDRIRFLQDLVTNKVTLGDKGLTYAALLTPQGKYLADFFVFQDDAAVFLDADQEQAAALIARLSMYRLRADVAIEATDIEVHRGLGAAPEGALSDPRSAALGWRSYGSGSSEEADWAALYVAEKVPSAGIDLIANESYILEMGFERLHGVDFRKGCYVGQEVTARMKHKTELRKGLARVELSDEVPTGTDITLEGKRIGRIGRVAGRHALAYLRFDQAGEGMEAGGVSVTLSDG